MIQGEYYIMPSPNGGWNIKFGETMLGIQHFLTLQEAILRAREITALEHKSDFIIHFRNGRTKKIHVQHDVRFRT